MEGSAPAAEVADRLYFARRGSIGRIALRCARLGGGGVSEGRCGACGGVAGSQHCRRSWCRGRRRYLGGCDLGDGRGHCGRGGRSGENADRRHRDLVGSLEHQQRADREQREERSANRKPEDATCRSFARSGGAPGVQRGGRLRPGRGGAGQRWRSWCSRGVGWIGGVGVGRALGSHLGRIARHPRGPCWCVADLGTVGAGGVKARSGRRVRHQRIGQRADRGPSILTIFARQRTIAFSSTSGTSGRKLLIGGGGSLRSAAQICGTDSPANGGFPVIASNSIVPMDQMSVRASTSRADRICSGDM